MLCTITKAMEEGEKEKKEFEEYKKWALKDVELLPVVWDSVVGTKDIVIDCNRIISGINCLKVKSMLKF